MSLTSGYVTPQGAIYTAGGGAFDSAVTISTSFAYFAYGNLNFYDNKNGPSTDVKNYMQPLYDNPFYAETLLTTVGPDVGMRQLSVISGLPIDFSKVYAPYNSVYCLLSTYVINPGQMTITLNIKRTNVAASPTASEFYSVGATTYPPYTFLWQLIPTYLGVSYPINPNTTIETPNTAFTRFSQALGSGYTKQLAQCTITDSRGKQGFSKVLTLNFI